MYRMYGIPQGAREGGADMYRMYGLKIAPAFSALPTSMRVVYRKEPGKAVRICTGCMG